MVTENGGFYEHNCARCGKPFIMHDGWAYKSGTGTGARLFCSWSCIQAWRKERPSKIERREKIIQAIYDGLSNAEIFKLLGEEPGKVDYWRKKLERENEDA